MKKIYIITAFTFMILASCKKDASILEEGNSNVKQQDHIMMNSESRALVIDVHMDLPGPYDLENQCSGETVTVTGTISDDMHIEINGNTMNFSEHQQGQLVGTGSLGNNYVVNVNENVTLNGISSNNGVFIINDVTIFRMISKGKAPNFIVRRNAHLTVTANGTVTVDRVDFTVTCPE